MGRSQYYGPPDLPSRAVAFKAYVIPPPTQTLLSTAEPPISSSLSSQWQMYLHNVAWGILDSCHNIPTSNSRACNTAIDAISCKHVGDLPLMFPKCTEGEQLNLERVLIADHLLHFVRNYSTPPARLRTIGCFLRIATNMLVAGCTQVNATCYNWTMLTQFSQHQQHT